MNVPWRRQSASTPGRRGLLATVAVPLMPTGFQPDFVEFFQQSERIEALCARYHYVVAAILPLDRSLAAAGKEACRVQKLVHEMEDAAGHLLNLLQATPAGTLLEATAKLQVAQALMEEALDPAREEFLALALAELQTLRDA